MRPLLLACLGCALAFAGGGGTVTIKGKAFMAEVAATDPELSKGLRYRQTLAKDRCMVFVGREDALHPLQTKHHLIALDVAWVDREGRVVETSPSTPPCKPGQSGDCPSYGGTVPSRHYIAFPVGTFKRLGLKQGDRLGWDLTLDDGEGVRGGLPMAKSKKK